MEKSKKKNEDEQDIYFVEKILDKQEIDGEIYYLLKWAEYDNSHNSWEPYENILNLELVEEYEKQLTAKTSQKDLMTCKEKVTRKRKRTKSPYTKPDKKEIQAQIEQFKKTNFSFRQEPCIVGIHKPKNSSQYKFLVRWPDKEAAELVPRKKANEFWPQTVINFYARHIKMDQPKK
ncbi:CLUMA_CG001175, isoform A [Clunio marinus]|uniref:CLUMA_CG001175, isoform A n=1 Tax=Clunio marinus TaxID=568069 RepID=A0A1J1HH93_9DIPT|nr:CLUMA_CG001175, isoform A [Clunio marinus]